MAGIINIEGRNWLAGMTWSSYEEKPDKAQLKADADRLNSDWAAIRVNESVIQAGFCEPINGTNTSSVSSLAAMLADSYEQPWLGIFKVSEGLWWYIAVRAGHAILPNGDVLGNEKEIIEARDLHSGYGDWKFVEGDIKDLSKLITNISAKRTPVYSLSKGIFTTKNIALTSMVLVMLTAAGGWMWKLKLDEEARAIERARLKAQLEKEAKLAPVISPLLTSPLPETWLSACKNVIYPLPLSYAGWAIKSVSCNSNSASVNWSREQGATVNVRPDGSVSENGNSIEQQINLGVLEIAKEDNSINIEDAKFKLRAWAQSANINLSFTSGSVPTLPGANATNGQDGKPLPPQRPHIDFKMNTPISPFSLKLSEIPGLRLNNINITDSDWNIAGTIYGR